ncbi:phage protein [Streptococcus pseudoporcinus]|uniref:Phage protein n=1 Tax=Streptococcus pseudoporcinus TaxID=361101 RepID=A0A4U9XN35_9STRE|nr:hypothetical protein [Streptococcus pseudoporcinus]VTS14108.1 phage protein [Streptococcus pseudoporcinus]
MNDVKIGGIVYQIEVKNDLAGEAGNWGETNLKKTTIALDSNMSKQRTDQTLVHEIVHGIFEEAGFEQDEDKVNRLGIVLYQVLKDNDFSFLRDDEIDSGLLKELSNQRMVIINEQEIADQTGKKLVADEEVRELVSKRLKGDI